MLYRIEAKYQNSMIDFTGRTAKILNFSMLLKDPGEFFIYPVND